MLTDSPILFGLVLLVAVASGWLLGRYARRARLDSQAGSHRFSDDYFRGLNYLLNEEQDKALEVFIRMVEVDSEAVETHFALGSLFRRRGEVDRAIRIHQNLIARPNLSREHRQYALYELGEDYMRAGLLDRAESLFSEMSRSGPYVASALRQLIAIYEQQHDWDQAIAVAHRLELVDGVSRNRLISHYLCELAELADSGNQKRRAAQLVKKAQGTDNANVRASIMAGTLKNAEGDTKGALGNYHKVIEQDPAFTSEVLKAIEGCYRKLGDPQGFDDFLDELWKKHPGSYEYVAMAAFYEADLRSEKLLDFIEHFLKTHGHGLGKLLDKLVRQRAFDPRLELDSARELVRVLLEDHPRFLCVDCGFRSNTLYWQCPSCREWGKIKPNSNLPYVPSATAVPDGTEPA